MKTKTVFDYSDLIHKWAHDAAPDNGRSKTRNVSVSSCGRALRHHATEIAAKIHHKGKSAFLLDNGRFSVTTSQIQGKIRSSLHGKVFIVHLSRFNQTLACWTAKQIVDYYVNEYRSDSRKSRLATKRAEIFLARVANLERAINAAEYFGLACAKLKKQLASHAAEVASFRELVEQYNAKLAQRRAVRDEAARAERERNEQARIASAVAAAEGDLSGIKVQAEIARREALTVQDWLNGVRHANRPEGETVLRVPAG